MKEKKYIYITLVFIMFVTYIILQIFYNASIEKGLAIEKGKGTFYDNIVKFFWTGNEKYLIGLTHDEIEHMKEVKSFADIICFILLLLIIFNFYFGLKIETITKEDVLKTLSIITILIIFVTLNFNSLFIEMHKIFFKTKWIFPENYELIKHYPREFFMRATILAEVLSIIATYVYFKLLED